MTDLDWSREEVEAIVGDYFHMLVQDLSGQNYNKSEHRRALKQKLHGRSDGSIERKHQNISAVLIHLGCFYVPGYKPLSNYQQLLLDVVQDHLMTDRGFDASALAAAELPATAPLQPDHSVVLTEAPVLKSRVADDSAMARNARARVGVVRDYLAREARNRSLGLAGEKFVVEYERQRLHAAGVKGLSERVDHVSAARGDGLGYDVLSFDLDGRERFIEVKTTTCGKETPFFVSRGEVEFSRDADQQFHLYRLFEFRRSPRMFDLQGSVQANCLLDPVNYVARFT